MQRQVRNPRINEGDYCLCHRFLHSVSTDTCTHSCWCIRVIGHQCREKSGGIHLPPQPVSIICICLVCVCYAHTDKAQEFLTTCNHWQRRESMCMSKVTPEIVFELWMSSSWRFTIYFPKSLLSYSHFFGFYMLVLKKTIL